MSYASDERQLDMHGMQHHMCFRNSQLQSSAEECVLPRRPFQCLGYYPQHGSPAPMGADLFVLFPSGVPARLRRGISDRPAVFLTGSAISENTTPNNRACAVMSAAEA